jgi:hypothetical protein
MTPEMVCVKYNRRFDVQCYPSRNGLHPGRRPWGLEVIRILRQMDLSSGCPICLERCCHGLRVNGPSKGMTVACMCVDT